MFTVTVASAEQLLPSVTVTVYVVWAVMFDTVTAAVASPVLHKYDVPPVAYRSDEPPETTVDGEADAAAGGKAFTVNCNTLEYASTL